MIGSRSNLKSKSKPQSKPKSKPKLKPNARATAGVHDDYLAALPPDQRAALEKLRAAILAAAPDAEECTSYQLAAFRHNGRLLVAMGATANHCAFYLTSDRAVAAHKDALKRYDTSKGTIRFQPDRSLPAALVQKLVKARIAENAGAKRSR